MPKENKRPDTRTLEHVEEFLAGFAGYLRSYDRTTMQYIVNAADDSRFHIDFTIRPDGSPTSLKCEMNCRVISSQDEQSADYYEFKHLGAVIIIYEERVGSSGELALPLILDPMYMEGMLL